MHSSRFPKPHFNRLCVLLLAWMTTGAVFAAEPTESEWFAFAPAPDAFRPGSVIDLRRLNEKFAGEHGFIGVREGEFIHGTTGEALRFWGVNGPPHELTGPDLQHAARMLSKYGVNLARLHGGYFKDNGEVDSAKVAHAQEIVAALKAEGIYSHFSIYFPLWMSPTPDNTVLAGYDGKKHPFAALLFNPEFQKQYRTWWAALLTTPDSKTGGRLVDDPAVAGVEVQNEDSFLFWTFSEANLPEPQLRLLESRFGDWLTQRHGSLDAAVAEWKTEALKRDAITEGRVAFRPLWNIANERTARDRETAEFLFQLQTRFYTETRDFLRGLGFKGVITASNWSTASPERLGPLEKLSYSVCDFVDRHGYFDCNHKGNNAEWSIQNGQTYSDRSALRFEAEDPVKPRQFVHPGMDPHYQGLPSMISETTWCRPNRHRGEAPLYLAAYGALQHSDGIVHFAFDGDHWKVKPGYFMQPWTLMTPVMMGQFPAAALIFRQRLIQPGGVLARIDLNTNDLVQLKGTPLPQDAALDELRLKDVPQTQNLQSGQRIDPLVHYAGGVDVRFVGTAGATQIADLRSLINHEKKSVTSSNGDLSLDYDQGLLMLNSEHAQGLSGNLKIAGTKQTRDLEIRSELEVGHIVIVPLDGKPIGVSTRLLLQIASEEQPTGWTTERVSAQVKRITSIGRDPWLVKAFNGTIRFLRADAGDLKVTALDFNGYPMKKEGDARSIQLEPSTLYYLISKE